MNDAISSEVYQQLRLQAQAQGVSIDTLLQQYLHPKPADVSAYLQAVLDSTTTGVMALMAVRDEAGDISDFEWTLVNYTAQVLLRRTEAELLGKRLLSEMPHVRAEGLFDACVRVVKTGTPYTTIRYYLQDDAPIWQSLTAVMLNDGVVITFNDISIEKEIEFALQESLAHYHTLFDEAPIAIWKQDFSALKHYVDALAQQVGIDALQAHLTAHPDVILQGLHLVQVLDANKVALQTHGATELHQLQDYFVQSVSVGESQPASLTAIARGEPSFMGKFVNHTPSGDKVHLLLKWMVVQGCETTYEQVLVAGIDITEQQGYENSIAENKRLVAQFRTEQEYNRLIQRSISTLSHDLRTPLAVIATSKDLLLKYFDKLTEEKRKEKLESIGKQLEFALELLDETVMTVRMVLSERSFRPAPTDLNKLCTVCMTEVGKSYRASHRLLFENRGKVGIETVDEVLISRVLLNLLSNAIKYSEADAPVRLQLDKDEAGIVLRVMDEGIGIAPDDLPRIFEPFFRAASATAVSGAGLGLSIVQECVQQHGGTIAVESTLAVGTTFVVSLPIP